MLKLTPMAIALSLAIAGSNVTVANSQAKPCPPGLAKRDNGCLPPGIAKKRYFIGQKLPEGIPYELITDLQYYGLTPPNGNWLYYMVDDDILRIADDTFTVLEAFEILFGDS